MGKKLRNGLVLILAAVFAVNIFLLVRGLMDSQMSDKSADTAVELAGQTVVEKVDKPEISSEPMESTSPEEEEKVTGEPEQAFDNDAAGDLAETTEPAVEEIPEKPLSKTVRVLSQLDLDALRKINENVLGWIYIPNSNINYPLLALDNNEDGLHYTWDGEKNSAGSIFLECRNSRDLNDFNTMIYGHNNRNGTMFSELVSYEDDEYLKNHRSVYIVTDDWVRRYEVFSVYEADTVSDTYRLYFEDDARKQSALDLYTSSSWVKTDVIPTVDDHILTLSTCMNYVTNGTRWVVQTVLAEEFKR